MNRPPLASTCPGRQEWQSFLPAKGVQDNYLPICQQLAVRSRRGTDDDANSLRGMLAWFYKRRWAIAAARGAARLVLQRLASAVGRGVSAAAHRRDAAEGTIARARRAACEPHWGRPVRPGGRIF